MHHLRRPSPSHRALALLVAAGLSFAPPASAAQDPGLRELLERSLASSPEVLALQARVRAAGERPEQARALPDPMVTGVYRNVGFPRVSLGDEMMSVVGFRVSQGLPYPGKRDLRAAAAAATIDVSEARVELTRRRIAREVAERWFELDYLERSIETVAETRLLLQDLEESAASRYAVGEGIQQDVLKAQVETSVLLQRLAVLQQQRDSAVTQLNRLAARDPGDPVATPAATVPPTWEADLAELQRRAAAAAAPVTERAREVRHREAVVDVARKERLPDFQLSTAWMNRGSLPDIWEVNVGISVPLYREHKQDRAVAEAEAELDAARQSHADAGNAVAAAVRDQYLKADRAARLVLLYRDAILPQATLSWESASAGYEVGRVDFLTVLDNLVKLLTFRVELHRQRVDYLQALARLEELTGVSLGALPADLLRELVPTGGTPAGRGEALAPRPTKTAGTEETKTAPATQASAAGRPTGQGGGR